MIRINLLPIKELQAEVNRRRDLVIGAVTLSLVAALLLGTYLFQSYQLTKLEGELTELRAELQALNSKVKEVAELQAKNEANKSWGLGSFDRWDVDQEVGDLVFSKDDGTMVTAPAQIIGSFSTNDNTWLWAWDNPSIVDAMKRDALKVKQYGEERGIEKLTTRKWTGTEEDAWAMTALAVKLTGAQGAYRGPSGNSYVFMTFGEVKISKPQTPMAN